jgi:lysophospholipase
MKTIITIILGLLISLAHAIPEKEFVENWKNEVYPFFLGLHQEEFKNAQGMTLKYFSYTHPSHKKTLVIVPGRTEAAKKYAELIYDLKDKGLDIFILDHQGQGDSDRLLSDTNKGHVIRFLDYVRDFEQFMNEVVIVPNRDIHLLSHSMGGLISSYYLARNPEVVKKAVMVAPMHEINTKPYTEKVATYYSKLLNFLGKGGEYAPGNKPYDTIPFEINPVTHSEARYFVESYLFTKWPHLAVGGPTVGWVHESLKYTKNSDRLKIKTPVLLLQAGQDLIVKPGRQKTFCRPSFCRLKVFPEARHEILMEIDQIRDEALRDVSVFFGF